MRFHRHHVGSRDRSLAETSSARVLPLLCGTGKSNGVESISPQALLLLDKGATSPKSESPSWIDLGEVQVNPALLVALSASITPLPTVNDLVVCTRGKSRVRLFRMHGSVWGGREEYPYLDFLLSKSNRSKIAIA